MPDTYYGSTELVLRVLDVCDSELKADAGMVANSVDINSPRVRTRRNARNEDWKLSVWIPETVFDRKVSESPRYDYRSATLTATAVVEMPVPDDVGDGETEDVAATAIVQNALRPFGLILEAALERVLRRLRNPALHAELHQVHDYQFLESESIIQTERNRLRGALRLAYSLQLLVPYAFDLAELDELVSAHTDYEIQDDSTGSSYIEPPQAEDEHAL